MVCPHAHKLEVSKRAERMKNDFINRRKARQSKYVKRSNVKFTDLTDSEKAVARAHFSAEAYQQGCHLYLFLLLQVLLLHPTR